LVGTTLLTASGLGWVPAQTSTSSIVSSTPVPVNSPDVLRVDLFEVLKEYTSEYLGSRFTKEGVTDNFLDFWDEEPSEITAGDYSLGFDSVENEFGKVWKYFHVSRGGKKIYSENAETDGEKFIGYYRYDFKGKQYLLLTNWSGGAHCCDTLTPILVTPEKIETPAQSIFMGDGWIEDYFVKDGKLYLWGFDTRFSYFNTCFACAGPMFFTTFFKFDDRTGALVNVNHEFRDLYSELHEIITKEESSLRVSGVYVDSYSWVPLLTAKFIYGHLAGLGEKPVLESYKNDIGYYYKTFGAGDLWYYGVNIMSKAAMNHMKNDFYAAGRAGDTSINDTEFVVEGDVVGQMTYGRIRIKNVDSRSIYPYVVVEDRDGYSLHNLSGKIRARGVVDMGFVECKQDSNWKELGMEKGECLLWLVAESVEQLY
jgi:hypothetical protein